MMDDDGQVFIFKMLIEQVAELRLGTDQMDPHWKSAASEDSPLDLRLGSLIGANGVKRDVSEHRGWNLLLFLDFEHSAAFVCPTLGAGAMGQLLFVAVGTLREPGSGKKVVSTAVGGAAR
jgi:hypothetical protein